MADRSREARFPFLDERVMRFVSRVPLWLVADLSKPPGTGDKAREAGNRGLPVAPGTAPAAKNEPGSPLLPSPLPCPRAQALLRAAARELGLPGAGARVKRAIQFGSALAKLSNVAEFGSNRRANAASAGSVRLGGGGGGAAREEGGKVKKKDEASREVEEDEDQRGGGE